MNDMSILKKIPKERLQRLKTLTEMKNASPGLIRTMDTAKERISEIQDAATETTKAEKQKENEGKNHTPEYPRTVPRCQKVQHTHNGDMKGGGGGAGRNSA